MTDKVQTLDLKQRYPLSLGIALGLHLFLIAVVGVPSIKESAFFKERSSRKPIQIVRIGSHESKLFSNHFVPLEPPAPPMFKGVPNPKKAGRPLKFEDLKLEPEKLQPVVKTAPIIPSSRPGALPKVDTAIKGITFENKELKTMAQESFGGAHEVMGGDRISLRYEVPNGKTLDELNESELRLYGFLRRGAKNYTTSIMAELHEFEMKYPHLHFPLTDTKQVLTGRLTYDEKGNLKQIKMIRWTNVDKLQGFFENVLKRMEIMQNPPKELWAENGEFTVFITLQING